MRKKGTRRVNVRTSRIIRSQRQQQHHGVVRRALSSAYNEAVGDLANAFDAAGVHAADDLAEYTATSSGAGNSSIEGHALKELLGDFESMSHSLASRAYKDLDIGVFQDEMNQLLRITQFGRLDTHPPDGGKVWLGMDQHFENYRPCIPEVDEDADEVEVPSIDARRAHYTHNPKANKTSPWADPFIAIAVVWKHEGRTYSGIIHFQFMWAMQIEDKEFHVDLVRQVVDHLDYDVCGVLLDSWYDSSQVRDLMVKLNVPVQHRLRFGENSTRYIWINGERHSLADLAKAVAADPNVKPGRILRWGPDGAPTRGLFKVIRMRGLLGAKPIEERTPIELIETEVEMQVAITYPRVGPAMVGWNGTSAVALHGNPGHDMDFCYHLRWTIETLFQILVDGASRTREQLINRKIVNLFFAVHALSVIIAFRDVIADVFPEGRLHGVPYSLISVRSWLRFAFVIDATQ